MKIRTISQRQLKRLAIFAACFLMSLILMDYSMLHGRFDMIHYHVVIFVAAMVIAICKKKKRTHGAHVFIFMLLMMLVSTFIRGESEYYLTNTLGILGIASIYNMDKDDYRCAVYGITLGALPYFLSWVRDFLAYRQYQGNRGPLCFTIIGLMLISILIEKKKTYAFAVVMINTILCLVGSSRTSMLCNIGCIFLMVLDMWKGKLTLKKLAIMFLSVVAVMIGFSLLQDAIVDLLSSKWGVARAGTSLFSNRELMWIAVLSEIQIWGYPNTYLQSHFGLGNVHNAYIQSYVSFGVIVGVLYVIWSVRILVKGIKIRERRDGVALLIPLLAITVISMFESTFILEIGYPLLGICVVLLSGQIERLIPSNRKKPRGRNLHVQS